VGPKADTGHLERAEAMRQRGAEVFRNHFSYFRNPGGVVKSMLLEAWVLLQKKGVIEGPYAEEKPA